MHKIILDEQASKTLDELEKIIFEFKSYPSKLTGLTPSLERILNSMNLLCEKTVGLIYRICFELLPSIHPLTRCLDQVDFKEVVGRSFVPSGRPLIIRT